MESAASGDQALLQAARSDPAAFESLYQVYFPRVFRYVRKRVLTVEEAEDLTSEVFIRAFRSIRRVRGPSFAAWVFSIAHNQVANYHRDRKHEPARIADFNSVDGAGASGLSRIESSNLVWQLSHRLTSDQQEVVRLKFAGGLTSREIGSVMGRSEAAVKMLLSRALQAMREAMVREES